MGRAKEVGEGSMPAPHYPGALVKMVRGAWERAACRPTLPRSALKMVRGHLGPSFAGSTPTPGCPSRGATGAGNRLCMACVSLCWRSYRGESGIWVDFPSVGWLKFQPAR